MGLGLPKAELATPLSGSSLFSAVAHLFTPLIHWLPEKIANGPSTLKPLLLPQIHFRHAFKLREAT